MRKSVVSSTLQASVPLVDSQHVATAVALSTARPHDFTLQYPIRREYFKETFLHDNTQLATVLAGERLHKVENSNKLLLYVHVPFCASKCYYCNFAVDTRKTAGLHEAYVDSLTSSLTHDLPGLVGPHYEIKGIDIGGGTPTLLSTPLLKTLLESLKPWIERTTAPQRLSIETTPYIAANDLAKMQALREGGVDRVSVGLQSTNNTTLVSVNRSDQQDLGARAISNLRKAGMPRVSVDLIFALPDQTLEHWIEDIRRVIDLGVDSVTTYDCLYRGKGRTLTKRTPNYPPWTTYGLYYDTAYKLLSAAGYMAPYGSVNFSRHQGETGTSSYFSGRLLEGYNYVGVGNYATSLVDNFWAFAPYAVDSWLVERRAGSLLPTSDAYVLPPRELMAKYTLLSLSFGFIDSERFHKIYGHSLRDIYGESIDYAVQQGWMSEDAKTGRLSIVPGSFRFMPQIRSLFYSTGALEWFQARMVSSGVWTAGQSGATAGSTTTIMSPGAPSSAAVKATV